MTPLSFTSKAEKLPDFTKNKSFSTDVGVIDKYESNEFCWTKID